MPKKEPTELGLWLSIVLAWELGYIIAIPAVVFGFGGAFADRAWGTSPLFLIGGFLLAGLLSGLGVVRKVKTIFSTDKR